MVAFVSSQPEYPLFEYRVATVPERKGETQSLPVVTKSTETILVPAIGTRAGVLVWEKFPGLARRAVVLTDRTPATLAEIGSPPAPGRLPVSGLLQPHPLCRNQLCELCTQLAERYSMGCTETLVRVSREASIDPGLLRLESTDCLPARLDWLAQLRLRTSVAIAPQEM